MASTIQSVKKPKIKLPNLKKIYYERDLMEVFARYSENPIVVLISMDIRKCPPCKFMKPRFIEFARRNTGVYCVYICRDEFDNVAYLSSLCSKGYPTFMTRINRQINLIPGSLEKVLELISKVSSSSPPIVDVVPSSTSSAIRDVPNTQKLLAQRAQNAPKRLVKQPDIECDGDVCRPSQRNGPVIVSNKPNTNSSAKKSHDVQPVKIEKKIEKKDTKPLTKKKQSSPLSGASSDEEHVATRRKIEPVRKPKKQTSSSESESSSEEERMANDRSVETELDMSDASSSSGGSDNDSASEKTDRSDATCSSSDESTCVSDDTQEVWKQVSKKDKRGSTKEDVKEKTNDDGAAYPQAGIIDPNFAQKVNILNMLKQQVGQYESLPNITPELRLKIETQKSYIQACENRLRNEQGHAERLKMMQQMQNNQGYAAMARQQQNLAMAQQMAMMQGMIRGAQQNC
jgi:hypothetical protein